MTRKMSDHGLVPKQNPTEFEFSGAPHVPERGLLAALIENMIQDLRGCGVSRTTRTKQNAKKWLMNDNDHAPFSFLWICEHLEMDPRSLRKVILEKCARSITKRRIKY